MVEKQKLSSDGNAVVAGDGYSLGLGHEAVVARDRVRVGVSATVEGRSACFWGERSSTLDELLKKNSHQ